MTFLFTLKMKTIKTILWEISIDAIKTLTKPMTKIRAFVKDKIDEWVNEEEESERLRNEAIQNRKHREENDLRKLMDSF